MLFFVNFFDKHVEANSLKQCSFLLGWCSLKYYIDDMCNLKLNRSNDGTSEKAIDAY
jgi:hypothetical protein